MEVRNRFKGLDLIEWVPEELWTEVHDIVQANAETKMENRSLLQSPRSGVAEAVVQPACLPPESTYAFQTHTQAAGGNRGGRPQR